MSFHSRLRQRAIEEAERRVRDLISSIGQLSVKIERNEVELWSRVNEGLQQSQQRQGL